MLTTQWVDTIGHLFIAFNSKCYSRLNARSSEFKDALWPFRSNVQPFGGLGNGIPGLRAEDEIDSSAPSSGFSSVSQTDAK